MKKWLRACLDDFLRFWWNIWHGQLGTRVMIVYPDHFTQKYMPNPPALGAERCRAVVRGTLVSGVDTLYAENAVGKTFYTPFADRGVTWCYGWKEEDAAALCAAAALERSR